ncbi:MAG: glycosyltransferase family 2 protein [Candidatus Thorarchaeota archaeon]
MNLKTVIGLPAYNEEKNIAKILTQLTNKGYEIIVCNDGSDDLTGKIAEKMGVSVIHHEKNLGYGAAIRSIFQKAKEMNCDVLVTFDTDGQHRIEDISKVIEPILNDESDIVIGSRFLNNNDKVPKYRKIGIKAITKLSNVTTELNLSDSQSGFRSYNKKAITELNPSDFGMGVSTELLIKASQKKLRIVEVPITILYGENTSTHHPVKHGASVLVSTVKFTAIEHPLKFYGLPGAILLTIGLFFIVWTIQEFTITRQIITNLALIGTGSTLLGSMLLITSIILFSIINVVREK